MNLNEIIHTSGFEDIDTGFDFEVIKEYDDANIDWTNGKWSDGVLALNNKIYTVPYNSTYILVIDTITKETSKIENVNTNQNAWSKGTLAMNGKIYCTPSEGAEKVLVIDPRTDTTYLIGSFALDSQWADAVLAQNGKIYCSPDDGDDGVLVIDTNTDTTYVLFEYELPTDGSWKAICAPTDRHVIMFPYNTACRPILIDVSIDAFEPLPMLVHPYLGYEIANIESAIVTPSGSIMLYSRQGDPFDGIKFVYLYDYGQGMSDYNEIPNSDFLYLMAPTDLGDVFCINTNGDIARLDETLTFMIFDGYGRIHLTENEVFKRIVVGADGNIYTIPFDDFVPLVLPSLLNGNKAVTSILEAQVLEWNSIRDKADLDSPEFVGTPTVDVSPSHSDNSTRLASTEFVHNLIEHSSNNETGVINSAIYSAISNSLDSALEEGGSIDTAIEDAIATVSSPAKKIYMEAHFSYAGSTVATTEICQGVIDAPSFKGIALVASGLIGLHQHAIDYGDLAPCNFEHTTMLDDAWLSTAHGSGTIGLGEQTKFLISNTSTVPIKKIMIRIEVTAASNSGHYGIKVYNGFNDYGDAYYQLTSLYAPATPTNRLLTWGNFDAGNYMTIVLEVR